MTGLDLLVDAIRGPRSMGSEVTGYDGQLISVDGQPGGGYTGASRVSVAVAGVTWQVSHLSGPFVAELNAGASLLGRTVRVHIVNGQPEVAYTVDPAAGTETVAVATWATMSQTITVNGVAGCTANWAWYVDTAAGCELRFLIITASGALPTVPYLTVPFPTATVPRPADYPPFPGRPDVGPYGIGVMNYTPVAVRLDPDGGFYVFANGNPSGAGYVDGSISYHTAQRS